MKMKRWIKRVFAGIMIVALTVAPLLDAKASETYTLKKLPTLKKGYSYVLYSDGLKNGWLYIKNDKTGLYGFANLDGKIVTPCEYSTVGLTSGFNNYSTLFRSAIRKDGKAGAIYLGGKKPTFFPDVDINIIEFRSFGNGAELTMACVRRNEKYGFVNLKGKQVIPCKYDDIRFWNFDTGLFVAIMDGKEALVNSEGKEIVPFGEYDRIEPVYHKEIDEVSRPCYTKLFVVSKDGKQGYINSKGKEVLPCIYSRCDSYSCDDRWRVLIEGKDERGYTKYQYGYVDDTGKEVIKCQYSDAGKFYDGYTSVLKDGVYYCIDKKGKRIGTLDEKYQGVKSGIFVGGVMEVYVEKNGKRLYGCINPKGKEVIPCKYDSVSDLFDGLAVVRMKGKYGLVNKNGKVVLPIKYDEIEDSTGYGLWKVYDSGKIGCVDRTGKFIVQPIRADVCYFIDHIIMRAVNPSKDVISYNVHYTLKGEEIATFKQLKGEYSRGGGVSVCKDKGILQKGSQFYLITIKK